MPYLGSTVFVATLVVTLLVSLCGYLLLVRAAAPAFVDRAERAATHRPWASALVGFPVAIASLVVCGALFNAPAGPARAAGALVLALVLGAAFAGLAGLAQRAGRALPSPADDTRPWLLIVRGAVVIELAALVPILGWFLVLPIVLAVGTGAACLATLGLGQGQTAPAQAFGSTTAGHG
jgi:hypothetical protein